MFPQISGFVERIVLPAVQVMSTCLFAYLFVSYIVYTYYKFFYFGLNSWYSFVSPNFKHSVLVRIWRCIPPTLWYGSLSLKPEGGGGGGIRGVSPWIVANPQNKGAGPELEDRRFAGSGCIIIRAPFLGTNIDFIWHFLGKRGA